MEGLLLEWVSPLLTGLFGIAGALGGVALSSVLAEKSSQAQKLKDLRLAAYSKILSSLRRLEMQMEIADDLIRQDADRYFNEKSISDPHTEAMGNFLGDAIACFEDNFLVLSKQFNDRFIAMRTESFSAGESPDDAYKILCQSIRKALPELTAVAKSDLGQK